MNIERRYFPGAEFRVEKRQDKPSQIVGYPAKFNTLSVPLWGFRERILPGAFTTSLAEGADVRALMNHDPNRVLGRTGPGTLRLREDSIGLRMEVDAPDTTYARDLLISLERRDIDQGSFQFRTITDKWQMENGENVRDLVAVELIDTSVVTFPAYGDTPMEVRSALWPSGVPDELLAHVPELRQAKTKRVDGEDLPASAFAYVGDAKDTSTWKLPIKFSSEEKTKSHIRNALARFNQTNLPSGEKDKVWAKIVAAAKKHGIDVAGKKSLPSLPGIPALPGMEMRRRRLELAARS
jgi:HK97 family phage prohead protease